MTITKEAIEAAKAAYWHEAHNGGGYSDKCYEAALMAALPFLPIAGEGKVKALEWSEDSCGNWFADSPFGSEFIQKWKFSGIDKTVFEYEGTNYDTVEAAKAAAQTDYEALILSALSSSPGKDGGQEVEAISDAMVEKFASVYYGGGVPHLMTDIRSALAAAFSVRPQPASTALVEAMRPHIGKLRGCVAINEAMGRVVEGQADATRALITIFDALSASQSTSREKADA